MHERNCGDEYCGLNKEGSSVDRSARSYGQVSRCSLVVIWQVKAGEARDDHYD